MGVSATNRRSEIAEEEQRKEEQRGPSGDVDGGGGRGCRHFQIPRRDILAEGMKADVSKNCEGVDHGDQELSAHL